MNSIQLGDADLPLEPGQCPIDFKIHKSFTVPLVLFDEKLINHPFPIYLKYNPKLDQDCKSHRERVGNYLKIISSEIFEAMVYVVDPNEAENTEFFKLYNQIAKERSESQAKASKYSFLKCQIF